MSPKPLRFRKSTISTYSSIDISLWDSRELTDNIISSVSSVSSMVKKDFELETNVLIVKCGRLWYAFLPFGERFPHTNS